MKKILSIKNTLVTVLLSIFLCTSPLAVFADEVGSVTGEITVSCYDSTFFKNFLENAARSFEVKYPGTKVKIDAFSAMPEVRTVITETNTIISYVETKNDPNAQNDYRTRINTEMMSGGGADIYAIDVLQFYKYADSGMFEDLRHFMDSDPDFDYKNYRKNIFDATMYCDGQYILPLDYGFSCLSYDTTLMDSETGEKLEFGMYTYDELMEFGYDSFMRQFDPNAENPIKLLNLYGGLYGKTLYSYLLNANYNSFVDVENKKANFTDGRFEKILTTEKEYVETGYIDTYPVFTVDMQIMPQVTPQLYMYKWIDQIVLLETLIPGESFPGILYAYGPDGMSEDNKLMGLLTGDNGESVFSSSQSYAMNSNSKNKVTAWTFLKFLLGDEMQSSMSLRYEPVNINAAVQKAKYNLQNMYAMTGVSMNAHSEQEDKNNSTPVIENKTEETDSESEVIDFAGSFISKLSYFDGNEIILTEEQQEIYEKYMDYMNMYTPLLNSYTVHDIIMDGMIETEVKKFYDGSRTANEVALTLQNKINLYLQE